ncbi:MAG: MBL fold metallo-hydrolase [Chloroflexota bacterium]
MSDDRYRFTVGDFECLAIKDTDVTVTHEQLFSNQPKEIVKPHLKARGEKAKAIQLSYNPLAVYSDDWVLIDTGIGTIGNAEGQVAKILEDEEIRPEHIIITHLHADHYGGLITDNGEEAFGNVPVYLCQGEWAMVRSEEYAETNPQRAELIQQYVYPIERQFEPIECLNMNEILPGLSVLRLVGHTENHIGVLIESQTEKLIYVSDALIHPLHLEQLDWECGFDANHEHARESRVALAELAIELNASVMSYHFPFPGIGRIEREGDGYHWVATTS